MQGLRWTNRSPILFKISFWIQGRAHDGAAYCCWHFNVEKKCVCQCNIMSHLHRRGNPKLLPQTVAFWIDASLLLVSNCVQICVQELGFIVRYTGLLRGCVSWLIEWNRARYSVLDVTRGYILLMYPAVSLLTSQRRNGEEQLYHTSSSIRFCTCWHWLHIYKNQQIISVISLLK